MKRIITTIIYTLTIAVAFAQNQKAGKSVFTLTTFKADGTILASTNGVFIGSQGDAVSAWTPFVGAKTAVCIDADGRKHAVEAIYGANELYDVCRFRVDGETQPASVAKSNVASGSKVSLVTYALKGGSSKTYTVENVEKFGDQGYGYYIFKEKSPENIANCPFVNKNGEVIGLLQHAKSGEQTHAVDARFITTLAPNGLSINDPVLRRTAIRTALPSDLDGAKLTLMMAGERGDSAVYSQYVDDMIRFFPKAIDGYSARAQQQLWTSRFAEAETTMQSAVERVEAKDEAHSALATLIYQKQLYFADSTDLSWTLDRALNEAKMAYDIKPQPVYLHQQAQIKYSMGDFADAYKIFLDLTNTDIRNGELFYEAAQCQTSLGATTDEVLVLLDSAVAVNPHSNISAPYYLARGRLLDEAGETRRAVRDYNKYDTLMLGRASHDFYYLKFKAESKIRQYQQALNDIAHAIVLNRAEPTYYAEMASLQLRVNQLEDAIRTADMGIAVAPEYADPYIVKGVALGELKRKSEAVETLRKAQELGDERAKGLIEKYK